MDRTRFNRGRVARRQVLIAALALSLAGVVAVADEAWREWGGDGRDFTCTGPKLAQHWPDAGPHKLWSRPITHGHATILVDGDRLYTTCRREDQDVVLALAADTGETVWECAYDAPVLDGMDVTFGPGPHATPLIVGDRLFTVGAMGHLHCLAKDTGKVLWKRNLVGELRASFLGRGYGPSPIAHGDTIIVNIGSPECGVAALKQDSGETAWRSPPFRGGYSSPIIVPIDGKPQLLHCLAGDRFGLDPDTGAVLWQATVPQQSWAIMASPLFVPPNKVLFSAGYGGGTRLFEIASTADGYEGKELWHCRKLKIHHANAILYDDFIVGSSGDFGPAFLMAVDLATGDVLWRKRGFAKSTLVRANDQLIILDERGQLALATPSRDGLDIHARATLLQEKSWTAPTLVGTRLYLRDYHTIMALDLSPTANAAAAAQVSAATEEEAAR
jgi:outer membrane protein assembly factor BamB